MRPRSLLTLLVVVVASLAFIWFVERDLPSTEERAELAKKVLRVERETISGIEIEVEGQRVRLERQAAAGESVDERIGDPDDGEWRLVEPLVATADPAFVDRLLDSLTGLEKQRTLEGADPVGSGLDPPRARVVVRTAKADLELSIGSEIPASSSMIVAAGGQAAYVVSNALWSQLTRAPGDWRSKEVFQGRREAIERIHLTFQKQRLVLAKRGEDFWVESPLSDRADEDQVQDLLTELTGLRVAAFVDDFEGTRSSLGLEPPVGTIEVVLQGEEDPFVIDWGGTVPDKEKRRYAAARGQIFEVESDLGDSFARRPEEWRSLAIMSFDTYQIDIVRVADRQRGEIVLERAGADWRRNEDEISFTSVSDFLFALTDTEAASLLSEDEAREKGLELEEPVLEITLEGDDRQETVSIFGTAEAGIPVRVSDRQIVALIERESVDEILAKLDEVRHAESKSTPEEVGVSESADG